MDNKIMRGQQEAQPENARQIYSFKRGRPPKEYYDPEILMQEMIDTVTEVCQRIKEIKATVAELFLSPDKVKKLLNTGKVISYPEMERIHSLLEQGKTIREIQRILGLSYSTIHIYLPYSKGVYKRSEVSQNAERVNRYKNRKQVVAELQENCTKENLWSCIIAFQKYPFFTASGLPSTY